MESSQQIVTFAITLATGGILGLFFDIYRIVYNLIRPRPAVTYITDLLFWLFVTVFTFVTLIISNWGELRAYVFLGLCTGAGLYFRLLSAVTRKFLLKILIAVRFVVLWLKRLLYFTLLKPVAWIVGLLLKPFAFMHKRAAAWFKARFTKPPDEKIPPS